MDHAGLLPFISAEKAWFASPMKCKFLSRRPKKMVSKAGEAHWLIDNLLKQRWFKSLLIVSFLRGFSKHKTPSTLDCQAGVSLTTA